MASQSSVVSTPATESDPHRDPRVAAVLAVLRGGSIEVAAQRWALDPALVQRWVGAFVDAGVAQVTNTPDPEAAARRDRFLAAFTYEIREPLAAALSDAGKLGTQRVGSAAQAATAVHLEGSLNNLSGRVADAELLVAAALGGLRIARRTVEVGSLVESIDPRLIGGEGPRYQVDVDPVRFGRVLSDMWTTSAMAPEPRSRRVVVQVIEPWVEIRVMRDADPIATDILEELFEPFRADRIRSGSSIGLYLARVLTVAHGGTIGLDQDDDGAALWVRVPLRPLAS